MNDEMTKELEIISNALGFLQRVELKGLEAQQLTSVLNYLIEKGNSLQSQLNEEKSD